jgi:predicted RNA methylase
MPRRKADKYLTPMKPVIPLVPFIHHIDTFDEPCAGDGRLVNHLVKLGKRVRRAFDTEPDSLFVAKGDALTTHYDGVDAVITNPPWSRPILHDMIAHFVETAAEAWLLFDSNWVNTGQSAYFLKWCTDIVPIGRVKWIEDSEHDGGKEDASWFRFSADSNGQTIQHPRVLTGGKKRL